MRTFRGVGAALLLTVLSGCSAGGSLFAQDAAQVQSADRDPPDDDCAKVAARRADDAVLAGYVEEGSADQKDIYNSTYRDCVDWKRNH